MLKKFHDAWYGPNDAVLAIVGGVDPQATLAKVRQLSGSIPGKVLPVRPEVALGTVVPKAFQTDSDLP